VPVGDGAGARGRDGGGHAAPGPGDLRAVGRPPDDGDARRAAQGGRGEV